MNIGFVFPPRTKLDQIRSRVAHAHPNCIVAVQVGYFLELAGEDAKIFSNLIGTKIYLKKDIQHTGIPQNAFRWKDELREAQIGFVVVEDKEDFKVSKCRFISEIYEPQGNSSTQELNSNKSMATQVRELSKINENIFGKEGSPAFPDLSSGYRRVCILANSWKKSGKCIAGLEYESGQQPFRSMRYMRPVYEPEKSDGQIPQDYLDNCLVQPLKLLDIFDIPIARKIHDETQPENWELRDGKWIKRTTLTKDEFAKMLPSGWESGGLCGAVNSSEVRCVEPHHIDQNHRSLQLIEAKGPCFYTRKSFYRTNSQKRVRFSYQGAEFDLPVTDECFSGISSSQDRNSSFFFCVSLSVLLETDDYPNGAYWRLVSGVIGEQF